MEVIEVSGYVAEEKLAIAKVMEQSWRFRIANNFHLELFNSIHSEANKCETGQYRDNRWCSHALD